MLGYNPLTRAKLLSTFYRNVNSADLTRLDLVSFSMQMNGISLTFIEQLTALGTVLTLPDICAKAILENRMFCQEIRMIGQYHLNGLPAHAQQPNEMVIQEYSLAIEQNRVHDIHLIITYAKAFIYPELLLDRQVEEPYDVKVKCRSI